MISVIIPVLNESATIASVVQLALKARGVTEVLVIDDGSIDGTPEEAQQAGARVVTSTLLGKGASMEDGMWAAQNEILLYLDGDLSGVRDDVVELMTAPLLEEKADFVKAQFTRRAGRVTMLTARPLLVTFFPELAEIEQPLSGIMAAKRSLLRNLRFEVDYGVDVGLLLDAMAAGATIVQVDIGHIKHESQSLEQLGDMAKQVVRVILDRAARYNRLDTRQIREVEEIERRSLAELSLVFGRIDKAERLALFDMDGTLLKGRFVVNLAQRTNKISELSGLLDNTQLAADDRTRQIAMLFAGVSKDVFEEAARSIPLTPGAAETIVELRKLGYQVGIVSDSFYVAAEIVRRRVFGDFSIAHLMRFHHGVATGEVTLSPAMQHENGCQKHKLCKMNVLLHLCHQRGLSAERVIAVGDSEADVCMLAAAGKSVAFQPKSPAVEQAAQILIHDNLKEILTHLPS